MQGAPADVAFLVQLRRAQIRQSDSSNGTGSMSVNSRLRFERFKARADEFTLKARQEQVMMDGVSVRAMCNDAVTVLPCVVASGKLLA